MRLTRLNLIGFKSFAEKLEIGFESGITAIVGPNGCGKTNLSDAIRWALGEQSAKLLRGDRMDDLIFAGTTQRKPLGMAEVSLTFADNAGDIPTDFRDVTVSRRLYRSGESEYLLNGIQCRLRDITDLFLDTGLGGEPYALIEQGAIGEIVGARPYERRLLIEEAAGIMTYKVRKRSALAKLESAEQNLLRVGDILHEVERQRNSLKRQANKAERYRAYQDRATELKAFVRFHEGDALRRQVEEAERAEQGARHDLDGAQAALATVEAELERHRILELEHEEARGRSQARLHDVRSRLTRDEAELNHLRQMLEEMARQQRDRRDRVVRLSERRAILQQEDAGVRLEETLLTDQISDQDAELARRASALQALERSIADEARGLDVHRRRLVQEAASLAERRNHLGRLREREQLSQKQRDLAVQKRETVERQDGDLASLEGDQQGFLDRVKEELARLEAERAELAQQSLSEESARESIKSELDALREESQRLNSRLASLRELDEAHEGYADGHRYLLQRRLEGDERLAGLVAPLAELIEAPARYERAIEALLADSVQGLVVRQAGDVEKVLRVLGERGQGRATLLVPFQSSAHHGRITASLREHLAARDSSHSLAIDLIQCADGDRPLLQALLADSLIVDDLATALSLVRDLPPPFTIATRSGEVLSSRGIVAGGSGGGAGLLGRRREIGELEQRAGRQDDRIQAIQASWDVSARRSSHIAEALESLGQRIDEVETDRLKAERELSLTRGERRRLTQQIEVLTYESKSHAEDLRGLEEEIRGFESGLLEDEERYRLAQSEVALLEGAAASRHQERHDLTREVGELRVRLTALHGERELLARRVAGIADEIGRLDADLAALQGEDAEGDARRTAIEATAAQLREALSGLVEEEQAAQLDVGRQDEVRTWMIEGREALDARLREVRQHVAGSQDALQSATVRRAELRNSLLHLEATLAEEGLGDIETIAAQLAAGGLVIDAAREELSHVTTKMAEMGTINLAALEEYQELSERHRFLSAQAQDLDTSARSLRATIAEINKTIEQRFSETLQTVNGHLDRLWKRLFSGGEAELRIVEAEPGDEEPGLEFAVRVPGKRATLNLLSGGEKALAALALLLALFLTRPSPFCLLDEVDAPLDDANVDRFLSLLKEMAAQAQFIVITHNKRTMEAADILYGVTMEEHGLSKILSVRMSQAAA
jgi:chromosome segregation protein